MSQQDAVFSLKSETETARQLLMSLADVLGDDADLVANTVEGETGLMEAIERAVNRIEEIDTLIDGISALKEHLASRSDRLDAQKETLRTAVLAAMEIIGKRKLEFPVGTVSIRAVPPKAIIDDEADIPSKYFVTPAPRLDRAAILRDLKDKIEIPGAKLSNGGMTIQIK